MGLNISDDYWKKLYDMEIFETFNVHVLTTNFRVEKRAFQEFCNEIRFAETLSTKDLSTTAQ